MRTGWIILITALVSSLFSVGLYKLLEKPQEIVVREANPAIYTNYTEELLSGNAQRDFLSSSPTNFIVGAKKATPGVVNIKSSQGGDYFWESLNASTGSGVIIAPNGYIVTNNHVVEEGKSFKVTLHDKREFEAKLIGTDPSTYLALLKITTNNLPYLTFGNEKDGVSEEALKHSDGDFIIPQMGMVQSLNISVACAVVIYEALRQRKEKGIYQEQVPMTVEQQDALFESFKQRQVSRDKGRIAKKIK